MTFDARLRQLIAERGLSYRRLAARIYLAKSHLHRIAHGAVSPTLDVVQRLDTELGAGGELVAYLHGDQASRESADLIELLCGGQPVDAINAAAAHADQLALEYLSQPPAVVLDAAADVRRAAMLTLGRLYSPSQRRETAELLLALGRLSGILAYAALDLGDGRAARQHIQAAWQCADTIDHHPLRAWVRGTQSLICRFESDFSTARKLAEDGMRYAHDAAAQARLLCGQGQSHANLGDGADARRALLAASDAHQREHQPERGLFGFSAAKLAYYSGSARIWLGEPRDAKQAEADSIKAITLWQAGDPQDRAAGDEALAHVYLATARLQLHQLEGAEQALAPVLGLPAERRLSWIRKRLQESVRVLSKKPFVHDPAANNLRDEIQQF